MAQVVEVPVAADEGDLPAVAGQIGVSGRRYADMPEWERLASEAGYRLPQHSTAFTTGHMERWLRRLGIPVRAYLAWNGAGLDGNDSSARLSDFIKRNPDWSLRAWAGLVLEHRDLILGGA